MFFSVSLDIEEERQIHQNKSFVLLHGKTNIYQIKAEQTAVIMHDTDSFIRITLLRVG